MIVNDRDHGFDPATASAMASILLAAMVKHINAASGRHKRTVLC
jgi:hypothetical protein